MVVREIKTTQAINAINQIKSSVRKDGLGLVFNVPKEFIEKRIYMQSDAFLKDEHNVKMFKLGEKLITERNEITKKIEEHNKKMQSKREQCYTGYAKIKNWADRNEPSSFFMEEYYYQITKIKMKNLAKKVKNALGLK